MIDDKLLEFKLFQRIALIGFPDYNVYAHLNWDRDNPSSMKRDMVRYISEVSPGITVVLEPNNNYKIFFSVITPREYSDYIYDVGEKLSSVKNIIYNMGATHKEAIEEASKMTDEELLLLIRMV